MAEYPVPTQNETPIVTTTTTDQPSGTAKEKASQTAQTAADSGAQVAQTAAEQAKTVAAQATAQARDLAGEARNQVRDQAAQQQSRAVSGLRDLADELRSMADNSEQSGVATEAVRQAAHRAHGVAEWLSDREPGELLDELRAFARRRPGAFLLGAAAAGVLAGRLTRGVTSASSSASSATERRPRPVTESQDVLSAEPFVQPTPIGDPALGAEPSMTYGESELIAPDPLAGDVVDPMNLDAPTRGAHVGGDYPSGGPARESR